MAGCRLQSTPRLLQASAAAEYLGLSVSKLRMLGIPRKISGGNRLYERADLDAYADSLPYEEELADGEGVKCADSVFGIAS